MLKYGVKVLRILREDDFQGLCSLEQLKALWSEQFSRIPPHGDSSQFLKLINEVQVGRTESS